MSRPRKKEIALNKESILSLMQEIYNELVEQRATAIRIQNKMLVMLKDPKDMTLIGPVIKEQQKLINDTIEKKITLSKLQATIWGKSANSSDDDFDLSDIDENLLETIQKDLKKEDEDSGYKLK